MSQAESRVYDRWIWLVILISALIRFVDLGSFSLSNDELSAVVRLNYQSFSDLINLGVVRTDPHPAGSQVFLYYWTKLFGISPFVLRLPFVLFGLTSIYLFYRVFKSWFGAQASLMAMTLFAFTFFGIVHGQLARPYAMGIFTVALFLYHANQIFISKDYTKLNQVGYVIGALLSGLTHYFAGLLVFLIALGLLPEVIRSKKWKGFLSLNALVAILFLPHVPITLKQLSRGDLTSWIPVKEGSFFWDHLSHVLNDSVWLYSIFGIGMIYTIMLMLVSNRERIGRVLMSLAFFLAPMLVGWIYTKYFGSVLMDRVLYFSTPFLMVLPFAMLIDLSRRMALGMTSLIAFVALSSSIFGKDLFDHKYTENFKDISSIQCEEQKQTAHMMSFGNFNSIDYPAYYHCDDTLEYVMDRLSEEQDVLEFMHQIDGSMADRIMISWACTYQPIEVIEYAKLRYKVIRNSADYYNSGYWLMEWGPALRDTLIYYKYMASSLDSVHIAPAIEIQEGTEFVELYNDTGNHANAEVMNALVMFQAQIPKDLMLVMDLTDAEGNKKVWKGKQLTHYLRQGHGKLMMSFKFPEDLQSTDRFKIYFWNPGKQATSIFSASISAFADSHYPLLY